MLLRVLAAAACEKYTECLSTLCEQNRVLNFDHGGTHNYLYALRAEIFIVACDEAFTDDTICLCNFVSLLKKYNRISA